jgi:hypothetical protein
MMILSESFQRGMIDIRWLQNARQSGKIGSLPIYALAEALEF